MADAFTNSLIQAMQMQKRDISDTPYIPPAVQSMESCLQFYATASSQQLMEDSGERARSLLSDLGISVNSESTM